jgi:multicomponent Na+:H+ antiporter subunit F
MITETSEIVLFAIRFGLICLSLAYLAALYRLVKGPTIPDRIIVIDLVASITIGITLLVVVLTGKPVYINIAMVIALIVFMGNVAFARYLKKIKTL